jgi:hypothetical protein
MARKTKRPSPTGANGNQPSPRRGEKTKQTKIATPKETEPKGARQTKLAFSFSTTGTADTNSQTTDKPLSHQTRTPGPKPKLSFASDTIGTPTNPKPSVGTPTNLKATSTNFKKNPGTPTNFIANENAITPEARAGVNRLIPPSPPTTPERTKHENTSQVPSQHKENTATDTAATKHTKHTKSHKRTKTTPDNETETAVTSEKPAVYRNIRYNGMIITPPSEKPFEDFLIILKKYFQIIQDVLGKDIHLASWDNEQEKAFPPVKRPNRLPSSRESLGIYLGNYINPKPDGSKIYLNLRLGTLLPHHVPLEKFGVELSDHFSSAKEKMSIYKQPKPCQATKSECVGWMMYSSKSISSDTFIPALRQTLQIPDEVAIGVQYRTIVNEMGKKAPFNRDDPPAAAIHLDIDEKYAMVFQSRASSLWRKNSKKRLPNGIQLRIVPCFSSAIGRSLTDAQRSDAKTLTERQYYFVKEHLKVLPPYYFISQLDTPLSPENPMTLRRAMMSQAPAHQLTSRLIHNVDASWNQPSKHTITTVVGRETEAQRFLANMIPEYLYRFGQDATKWFTGSGLLVYKEVKWNPAKGTTSSAKEQESDEMVKEDVWDLNTKWEQIAKTLPATGRPDSNTLDTPAITPVTNESTNTDTRLGSDKSIASFGAAYQRAKDDDDERVEETRAQEELDKLDNLTGTQFEFSKEQIERDRQKLIQGPASTGYSMSTAAKTTPSVRLKLKEAQEQIGELKLALAQQTPPRQAHSSENEETNDEPEERQDTIEDAEQLGSDLIEHLTEAQVLGAALAQQHKAAIYADPDAMEEDAHSPIHIGSLTSSDNPNTTSMTEDSVIDLAEDAPVIDISSKSTSSSETSSSTSSSTTTSSSSSDSSSSPTTSSNESSNSIGTQELVNRLQANTTPDTTTTKTTDLTANPQNGRRPGQHSDAANPHGRPTQHPRASSLSEETLDSIEIQALVNTPPLKLTTQTKNPPSIEETSGAPQASAELQIESNSGTRGDHLLPSEPFGLAGILHEDAGHGA